MVPRTEIEAVEISSSIENLKNRFIESGNSKIIVYKEDIDHIVGFIHSSEMFRNPADWTLRIKETPVVPETMSAQKLLKKFMQQKKSLAIVVDEFGGTSGIVTMEDLIEEIVGDIFDEYDESRDTFRTQVDNSIIIDGLASLDDVEQELDIEFGDVEMETLNGYLTELLGHIPSREDLDKEIVANGYRFKILSLGNRTIGRVRAEK